MSVKAYKNHTNISRNKYMTRDGLNVIQYCKITFYIFDTDVRPKSSRIAQF